MFVGPRSPKFMDPPLGNVGKRPQQSKKISELCFVTDSYLKESLRDQVDVKTMRHPIHICYSTQWKTVPCLISEKVPGATSAAFEFFLNSVCQILQMNSFIAYVLNWESTSIFKVQNVQNIAKSGIFENIGLTIGEQENAIQKFYTLLLTEFPDMDKDISKRYQFSS